MKLAVPNKGRLKEPTLAVLRQAGLVFELTDRALSVPVRNVDLELLFVRTDDIPELVTDGVAELGITGIDLVAEFGSEIPIRAELGYGRCSLTVAVPQRSQIDDIDDLAGKRVATAHPRYTTRFFAERDIPIDVVPFKGSVEVAPKLGVADAIVDLTSTGSTLLVNGLRSIHTLLDSEAVLVASPHSQTPVAERIAAALRAVVAGRRCRYLLLNAPADAVEKIASIIPGLEAPTVVPVAREGMVAIHSVVDADDVWDLLPELQIAGGEGILVLPIEQMVP